ncbi:MAG: ABC transporter substrate-binding protein [Microcoleus vaginatus WJT46-NPBG5]|jgi:branched-chain amino acid transport system substrate-binding protein|nr:ABC transporter substrate-binding protein [Microcoleus vaginatus WJT46-NPBG5]
MSKLVIFKIGKGDFEQGFPVTLEIGQEGKLPYKQYKDERLPPAPKLPEIYRQWQQKYYGLESMRRVIKIPPAQITNVSTEKDCQKAAKALEDYCIEWFNGKNSSFKDLRSHVREEVGKIEPARIIFQTDNELLRKLPWHLWDLFERLPHAEFSISARYAPHSPPLKIPVKILAILGGSEGIDITEDLKILEALPGTQVKLLNQPKREELNEYLWDLPWDILFFAGHSSSYEEGKRGEIQLNDKETISLSQLKNALERAIKNGLKLAIFNSCDGVGLANELVDLHIPQVIVMREPVPDRVAQKFLRYFLNYFSAGESFHQAVREAREKLQGLEGEFPLASWLPVIYQNPAENSPVWPRSPLNQLQNKICRLWLDSKVAVLLGGTMATALTVTIGSRIFPYLFPPLPPERPQPEIARISLGEKLLIAQKNNPDKEKGIKAFSNEKFDDAITYFLSSLRKNKNDPETLIYLNNAVAKQKAALNTGEKLKIAVSVPIGRESNVAEEVLRGVAQAQSELNCGLEEISRAIENPQINLNCSGGIHGKLLEIAIANDEDNPKIVEQVAEKLAKTLDILGVIGHYSSDSTLKAGSVYDANRLVVISPTSTAVNLSNFSEWVFRTIPSDAISAEHLVNYMLNELKATRAAVAYHRHSTYSESLKNEFRKRLPSQKFVAECDLSQGHFSADDCVNLAKQNQAEVLLLVPGTKDSLEKAFLVINSNNGSLKLLSGGDIYNARMLKDSGEKAEKGKMVMEVPWHEPSSEFARKAEDFWKEAANWRTVMAYDATQAMAEGLRRINGNPDRQRLRQVLSSSDFLAIGAMGNVEFEPSGDRKHSSNIGVLVQVQPNSTGNFHYGVPLLD